MVIAESKIKTSDMSCPTEEARRHKEKSKEILAEINAKTDKETKRKLKENAKSEKNQYYTLKKARWALLMNSSKLSDSKADNLSETLKNHEQSAVCYSMKEELCRPFILTDENEVLLGG